MLAACSQALSHADMFDRNRTLRSLTDVSESKVFPLFISCFRQALRKGNTFSQAPVSRI